MDPWFESISAQTDLTSDAACALLGDGFVVLPRFLAPACLAELSCHYDEAVRSAAPDDIKIGSTTTRVRDFVNRQAQFDEVYLYPPLLQACCLVIQQPFKLSTMHARTLRPQTAAQALHVDFPSDLQGFPMVGFILMIDDFTAENGATCFRPGSQFSESLSCGADVVSACGPSGSMIVFNGSMWHGHGSNSTDKPRRSIQGAYIRRTEASGETLPDRMQPGTLDRISGLARYLLTV